MELRIGVDEIKDWGLLVAEYLVLFQIYHNANIKHLTIDSEVYENLEKREYMRKREDTWVLLGKGLDIFEPKEDLFDTFIQTFPTRVQVGIGETRVLSPASSDTSSGKKLRRKWNHITKGKPDTQQHIIRCLEKEVQLREREGKLMWMRSIEPWLNNYTWEDYEYLLSETIEPVNSRDLRL